MIKVVFAVQQCHICSMPFSWNNIYWSLWVYKTIVCEKCGTKHKITASGRLVVTFLIVLPMIIFIHFLSPFDNALLTLVFGIFIALIGSLLTPFLVRFKVKWTQPK